MADEKDPLNFLDEPEGAQEAPSGVSGDAADEQSPEDLTRFKGMGPLLEEQDHEKVVKGMQQFVLDDLKARKRRRAYSMRNKLWVKGVRGVEIRDSEDRIGELEVHVPLGMMEMPSIMDRTDELIEKRIAHLISDPAVPEGEPASESDEDRDGAEFATRLLTVEGSSSGWNLQRIIRRSLRKGSVYGSGYAYFCIDPKGNGYRPMEIRATKDATTIDDAEQVLDKTTGTMRLAKDEELITRYVQTTTEGIKAIVDDPNVADMQWRMKIKEEILTPEHVVLIPATCSGISDADGVVLMRPTTWGKLVGSFPELGTLKEEEKRAICNWRPEDSQKATETIKDIQIGKDDTAAETKVPDHTPVVPLVLYFTSHGSYPKGAYIICAGDKKVLYRGFHTGMVPGAKKNQLIEECLALPLAQARDQDDDLDDDPHGQGTAADLGPADEFRGEIVLGWIDYIERFTRPHTFLPIGTNIQPGQMAQRNGDPILYNPQGIPVSEQVPPFPADAKEFFDRAGESQDSRSMLESTAQGVDSANSVSGVAKDRVIQQAHVNLTTTRANTADFIERVWMVVSQLYRVYATIPEMLKYTGDDGGYKYQEWTRADLGSTRDFKIAKGSFTQQSPQEKQDALDARYAMRDANGQPMLISHEDYRRLSSTNLSARLGTQDSPQVLRIRRQIYNFRKGAADEKAFAAAADQFAQLTQAYDAMVAEAQQAAAAVAPAPPMAPDQAPVPGAPLPAGGPAPEASAALTTAPAPVALPPAPIDPVADQNPFLDQLPSDEEQDVAMQRHAELRAEMAGTGFQRHHPRWQQFLLDEYARMKPAAGVTTLAEQQQAAAQQAQDAQDFEMKKEGMKINAQRATNTENLQAKAAEGAQRTSQDDAKRAAEKEEADAQRAHEANDTALRASGADLSGKPMESARNTTL